MKKLKAFSKLLLFVMALTFAFIMVACDNTEVTPPEIESVTLNQTTAEITLGEELDYSQFTLTVKYKDGAKEDENIPLTKAMITEGLESLNAVGTHELTVSYSEFTAKLTVKVNPASTPSQDGVTITLNKTAAEITLGESLKYSEFTVTVKYEDETKEEEVIALTAEMITDGLASLNEVGTHVLTVSYKGATAKISVTVKPAPVTTVEISLNKATAEITVGEDLDYDEFTVTVKYKDGSMPDASLPLTEEMITDGIHNLGKVGTHELTITVMGATTKLTVTVKPLVMTGARLDGVTKTYDGDPAAVSPSGLPAGAQVAYTYYAGEEADDSKKVDSMVNAGTYFVKAVVSAPNYEDKELTATVVINKRNVSVANVTWSNTGYRYTGEEITLAAKADNLPEYITYTFTAKEEGEAKATESGYYVAVAHFTSTNDNYTVDASCELTWKIIDNKSLDFEPWYGAENGEVLVVTFEEFENGSIKLHYGDDVVNGTVEYTDVITVTFPEESGYALTVDEGVMSITKDDVTVYLLAESKLNNFVGEYSTLADNIKVELDKENGTLKLIADALEEHLTIAVVDGKVQLYVDDTDIVLTYNEAEARVKLDGYQNPADFNQVDKDGIYLLTKEEVAEIKDGMATGLFTDFKAQHVLSVAEDKSVKYDGYDVQPYAVYYIAVYSSEVSGPRTYLSVSTNKRNGEFKVYGDAYRTYYGSTMTMFLPEDYKSFFGVYYPKNAAGDGFDTAAANKVSFMEHEGYYRIYIGSVDYVMDKDEISFSLENGVLTATLTKDDAEPVTATFNGASVTVGDKTYGKTQTLFASSSVWFYNLANGKYIKDNGNGSVYIYGNNYQYKSLAYTANGLEITLDVEGEDKVLIASGDARYITYDGVIHVSDSITNVSNGRVNATYSHGEDTVTVSNSGYSLKIDGESIKLTDLVYSIVDDGNDNGRTVIKVVGKADEETYTIVHYSLAAVLVNGVAYAHSNFVDIVGSEFKPAADSADVFAFGEDGKMTFRGEEIFLNGANTYSNFDLGKYHYAFDISKTSISFNDNIEWNIKYYFTAYFDFNGAYVSEDGKKVFYFDETTVYYDGTNSTSFKAKGTETGAKVTIGSKEAVFTKVAGGANTLVYDGATYTKVNFNLASYYGNYTVFDGSANGTALTLKTNPGYSDKKIVAFVIYEGNITPVVDSTYDSGIYLIKNTDAATSANLPVLAVQKRFVNMLGTTTFNGKTLEIVLGAVAKENSTDYITTVSVKYDGNTVTLNYQYGTYSIELGDVKYILQVNGDEATKADLPVLVFEAWWDEYDGSYTYNGKTLKVEIGVDATGSEPVPALKFTYDGAAVEATITEADGGRILTFAKDGVNYKGVMGGTPAVAVYTEAEFNFFFAEDLTNEVNGKNLVLVVKPTSSATDFNLPSSSYDGKELTFAKYMYDSGVIVFANADGYYAYDIVDEKFWSNVMDVDATLIGLNLSSSSTVSGYYTSGSDLYYTSLKTELGEFDKNTGKLVLTATMGGKPATFSKIDNNTYKVEGKNYNSKDIVAYLTINGSTKLLVAAEEYSFPGTHNVDGKDLVIAKSGSGYTASYDGGDAVAITPDFSKRSFLLNTADKSYMVSWTYTTEFAFTVSEVSAETMAFVGYGYSTYLTGNSSSTLYELTITYTGTDSNGKATFSIYWEQGWRYSGTVTGTLSDDGQKIVVSSKINYNDMSIYLNKNGDKELRYIMVSNARAVSKLLGEFAMGDSKVVIGVESKPTYDDDDEVNGYGSIKFVVTLDGKACTVATSWDTELSAIEFTCEGKTYTATYADSNVTVTEKAAA